MMSSRKIDLYEVLGVSKTATAGELRKAYFAMALKVHPDKNKDDPNAEANFKSLQQAYEILKDPTKRRHYDRTGAVGEDFSSSFWEAYQKYRAVEVTEEDIEGYLKTYRGSEVEAADLRTFFEDHKGDVTYILGVIIGSRDEDIPRFVAFFEKALEDKTVSRKYKKKFLKTKDEIVSEHDGEDIGSDDEQQKEEGEGDDLEDDEEMKDFIVDDEQHQEEEQEEEEEEEVEQPSRKKKTKRKSKKGKDTNKSPKKKSKKQPDSPQMEEPQEVEAGEVEDMDALRAAILGKAKGRKSGFEAFAAKYKGK